jgi:hypothetical protein
MESLSSAGERLSGADEYDLSADEYDLSADEYDLSADEYDLSAGEYDLSAGEYDLSGSVYVHDTNGGTHDRCGRYSYGVTSGIIVDIGERLDIYPIDEGYLFPKGVSSLRCVPFACRTCDFASDIVHTLLGNHGCCIALSIS